MDALSTSPNAHGRVKACTQCRQQKLRCDAPQSVPCSRCRRLSLTCTVTRAFKRQKAKTKAELVAEISRLKGGDGLEAGISSKEPIVKVANSNSTGSGNGNVENYAVSPTRSSSGVSRSAFVGNGVPVGRGTSTLGTHHEEESTETSPIVTDDASLRDSGSAPCYGVSWLTTAKAEACFESFFHLYSPFLPGIWACLPSAPAEYFAASPFLFWTIIATGARRHGDPQFLHKVAHRVHLQASDTILSGAQQPIAAIKAVLLLCIWPIPKDSLWKDPSPALIGAAVQLAIQQGLHVAGSRQEHAFSRTVLHMTEEDRAARARLWVYCVTVFQNTSLCCGFPPWMLAGAASDRHSGATRSVLSPLILYQYELQKLSVTAINTILHAVQLEEPLVAEDSCLDSLIEGFDAQLQAFATPGVDVSATHYELALLAARVFIRATHFFSIPPFSQRRLPSQSIPGLLLLHALCCSLTTCLMSLDDTTEFVLYMPYYYRRAVMLAGICILRISRSPLQAYLQTEPREQALANAVRVIKRSSIETGDTDYRQAIILTQLWKGKDRGGGLGKISGDPQNALHLKLRNRLSMSVVFECFWWWRSDFAGLSDPYNDDEPELLRNQAGAASLPSDGSGPLNANFNTTDIEQQFQLVANGFQDPLADTVDWQWPVDLFTPGLDSMMLDNGLI
ncbi:hypothetical protein M409DRAFT_48626 [Zasmidium cellare ATCC 36951]|uniref:Zn(2)-C6 fungal-type domain-containing protein n=1 Tax=Zasmidium cellare ATCC 36951 TaxID=1080233 RepID=A0A6A6D7R5_ZASCE|nr:uncharacterized protein M409DRAFT_48626 [Zasmidium cellare ATCC 36951]KAF2173686.1 hypothetical protein M409DRAFT_48626 [Zasmidium cellare ATCC 36951]